jgi:hypothetical protein
MQIPVVPDFSSAWFLSWSGSRFDPLDEILPPGFHLLMIFIMTFRSRVDFWFSSSKSSLPVHRVWLPHTEIFISAFSISSRRQSFSCLSPRAHSGALTQAGGLSFMRADPCRALVGRLRFVFIRRSSLIEGAGQVLRFHSFSISRANSPAAGARQVRDYDFILALLIFGSLTGSWFCRIPLGPCVFASGAMLIATGQFTAADPHSFGCCTDLAVGCYSSCLLFFMFSCGSRSQLRSALSSALNFCGFLTRQLSLPLSIFVAF